MLEIINQAAKGKSPEKDLSELLATLIVGIDDLPEDERKLTEEYLIRVLLHKLFRAVQVGDQQAAVACVDVNEARQTVLESWDILTAMIASHDVVKIVDELISDGEQALLFVNGWPKLMAVSS